MAITIPHSDDSAPHNSSASRRTDPAKERILDTAFTLFSERGYADVSMQEIATAIGMTKAALYYHFADKKTLFLEVYVHELVRYGDFMRSELMRDAPLRETLIGIARHVIVQGRGEFRRINTDVNTFIAVEDRAAIYDRYEHPSTMLATYLAQQQAAGIVRADIDTAFTGPLFLSMISGQVRRFSNEFARGSPISRLDDQEIAEKIVAIILNGIL